MMFMHTDVLKLKRKTKKLTRDVRDAPFASTRAGPVAVLRCSTVHTRPGVDPLWHLQKNDLEMKHHGHTHTAYHAKAIAEIYAMDHASSCEAVP